MNQNEKKLKKILDATVQEIWNKKSVIDVPEKELITLRLNMIFRKRHGIPEEESIYDELIQFIDDRGWLNETKT